MMKALMAFINVDKERCKVLHLVIKANPTIIIK